MLTPFTFSNPPFLGNAGRRFFESSNPPFLGNVGQENPSVSEDFVLFWVTSLVCSQVIVVIYKI